MSVKFTFYSLLTNHFNLIIKCQLLLLSLRTYCKTSYLGIYVILRNGLLFLLPIYTIQKMLKSVYYLTTDRLMLFWNASSGHWNSNGDMIETWCSGIQWTSGVRLIGCRWVSNWKSTKGNTAWQRSRWTLVELWSLPCCQDMCSLHCKTRILQWI